MITRIGSPAGWGRESTGRIVTEMRPTAIPLDSIQRVDIRKFSPGNTLLYWGGGLCLLTLFVLIGTHSGDMTMGY